jgi:hypothetical protein
MGNIATLLLISEEKCNYMLSILVMGEWFMGFYKISIMVAGRY